jgi:hypothetical protein
LFSSDDVYIFRRNVAHCEGFVSNNVLHNRTVYRDPGGNGPRRILLRVRYLNHVSPQGWTLGAAGRAGTSVDLSRKAYASETSGTFRFNGEFNTAVFIHAEAE